MDKHSFPLLSTIQLMQDLLSEKFNVFLVLIDAKGNELTLPSELPISCFEYSLEDPDCQNCNHNLLSAYNENKKNLLQCSKGLYISILKTEYTFTSTAYLIIGRTTDSAPIISNLPLLQAIFSLPVT